MEITVNPARNTELMAALAVLWERSVRSSHEFLTENDIVKLRPYVTAALNCIETLIVASESGSPTAFIGIADGKVEMLFVAPEHFGRGTGRTLMEIAERQYAADRVDVNEQNPAARRFYERLGFEVFERTELDDQGNRFPILRMRKR